MEERIAELEKTIEDLERVLNALLIELMQSAMIPCDEKDRIKKIYQSF